MNRRWTCRLLKTNTALQKPHVPSWNSETVCLLGEKGSRPVAWMWRHTVDKLYSSATCFRRRVRTRSDLWHYGNWNQMRMHEFQWGFLQSWCKSNNQMAERNMRQTGGILKGRNANVTFLYNVNKGYWSQSLFNLDLFYLIVPFHGLSSGSIITCQICTQVLNGCNIENA